MMMMKLLLTEDQERLRSSIEKMVRKDIAPRASEIDEKDEVPVDIINMMSEMGIFSILVPEEYGGLGCGLTEACLAMEEVSKGSVSCASYILGQIFGAVSLRYGGTEAQRVAYYPEIMKDANIAFAATEPQGGSDLGGIRTKAVLKGDHYIINGRKSFITNGDSAQYYVSLVRTEQGSVGTKGLSLLWIERPSKGFSIGKKEKKMGCRGVPVVELIFEDVKVPKSQLLGEAGKGMVLARILFSYTRTGVAAWAVGNAQAALEYAVNYIKNRPQFGQMISEYQAIRFMVVEMATKIEAVRSLIYRIASMADRGVMEGIHPLAAMAKWYATDIAMEVTMKSVQLLGAYGYTKEFPMERMMRDAKGLQIFEGTNEIQKIIISNHLL